MKILGINHDMYITSAALIIDGKIIAACAEERLNRDKLTRVFPTNAIRTFYSCGLDILAMDNFIVYK